MRRYLALVYHVIRSIRIEKYFESLDIIEYYIITDYSENGLVNWVLVLNSNNFLAKYQIMSITDYNNPNLYQNESGDFTNHECSLSCS